MNFLFFKVRSMPNVGLKRTTPRSRVYSTRRASQAPLEFCCQNKTYKVCGRNCRCRPLSFSHLPLLRESTQIPSGHVAAQLSLTCG